MSRSERRGSISNIPPLSSKAYNFSVAAEQASNQSQYAEALHNHNLARKYFRRMLKQFPQQDDPQTYRALSLVVDHHKLRATELTHFLAEQQKVAKQRSHATASDAGSVTSPTSEKVPNGSTTAPPEDPTTAEPMMDSATPPKAANETDTLTATTPTLTTNNSTSADVTNEDLRNREAEDAMIRMVAKEFDSVIALEDALPSASSSQVFSKVLTKASTSAQRANFRHRMDESFFLVPRGAPNKQAHASLSGLAVANGTMPSAPPEAADHKSHGIQVTPIKQPKTSGKRVSQQQQHPQSRITRSELEMMRNQQQEIGRLVQNLKTLSSENADLLKEREALAQAIMNRKDEYEKVMQMKNEYGKRFTSLKLAMEQFFNAYGHKEVAGELLKTNLEHQKHAQDKIRELTRQLERERHARKKLEAKIVKFQKWRAEIKKGAAAAMNDKQLKRAGSGRLVTSPHQQMHPHKVVRK